MANENPRTLLYGIIMLTFFIMGGVGILSFYQEADPTFDDEGRTGEFNRTFNKLNEVSTEVNQLEDNIKSSDTDFGVFGVLNALIFSSWQAIKFIFDSFGFMDAVLDGLVTVFGVPAWITLTIGLLITVMLVFAIYRMVFQSE